MHSKITILTTVIAATALLFSCGPTKKEADERFTIVTTIGMIADAADEIVGDRGDVIGLMGPGVDPHLYKASAGDVGRLQKADLILYNGLHLEARMGEVLKQMARSRPVHAVGESLVESDLIRDENFGGTHDPHVWFDVSLWIKVVKAVGDAVIEADPDGEELYRANLERYTAELTALDREVRERLSGVGEQQRVLVTAHDAFGYFGRAYDFDVRGLQGISTESEAGAKDIQDLADFITDNHIPAIFVESSVPKKSIEALQAAVRDRGFDVDIGGELFSDAMGAAGTVDGTYIGMVRHNVETVASALGQEQHD